MSSTGSIAVQRLGGSSTGSLGFPFGFAAFFCSRARRLREVPENRRAAGIDQQHDQQRQQQRQPKRADLQVAAKQDLRAIGRVGIDGDRGNGDRRPPVRRARNIEPETCPGDGAIVVGRLGGQEYAAVAGGAVETRGVCRIARAPAQCGFDGLQIGGGLRHGEFVDRAAGQNLGGERTLVRRNLRFQRRGYRVQPTRRAKRWKSGRSGFARGPAPAKAPRPWRLPANSGRRTYAPARAPHSTRGTQRNSPSTTRRRHGIVPTAASGGRFAHSQALVTLRHYTR